MDYVNYKVNFFLVPIYVLKSFTIEIIHTYMTTELRYLFFITFMNKNTIFT